MSNLESEMGNLKSPLRSRIRAVRRRLLAIGSAAGLVWALAAALVLLLAGAWLDLLWELSPEWRIATLCAAGLAGAALLGVFVYLTARAGRYAPVAQRLDRAARSGGAILTGLELDEAAPHAKLSSGLARLAVDHAAHLARRVRAGRAVPARPLGRSLAALIALAAAVGLLAVCLPGLARTQWNRFFNPFGDVPPYSQTEFVVEPAGAEVLYGSELDIRATVTGATVDQVELVLESENGAQETLPMFPEPEGRWRAALAKVTEPAMYYVRAYRARSEKYRLDVRTVPQIESVRLRVVQPEYANRPVYVGPLPKEGVAGLPGAKVQVWATSNRPLSGGVILLKYLAPGDSPGAKVGVGGDAAPGDSPGAKYTPGAKYLPGAKTAEVPMRPTTADAKEAVGEFAITADGKFELSLIDADGQSSQQPFTGGMTLLSDARPFIRVLDPKPMSLATPEAVLPVSLDAEDDCGISRMQFFRSLNQSRPLPADVRLPERPPRRARPQIGLPLDQYGLQPGDVVRLFGRVEDNDPAGAKGAESSVVTVQIISQEEFERMLRVREGVEVLMSKYREAQRRMESMAEEVDRLRKKLQEQAPGTQVAEETRQELKRLAKRMRQESNAIRKLSDHKLPFDLDEKLAPHLRELAQLPDEAAEELEKLLKQADLNYEAIARQLAKTGKKLASERGKFDQEAMLPMELLAAVFPLLADQSRFMILALRQKDLAERLAALKGRDGEDNPALKTRMRDLEQEQREIREELATLLDDIEDHLKKVPEDPRFEKLRETATKFVKDVRESGAAAAMAEAEAALAEFSGTRGYEKAKEAADILSKFLKDCEGMGGCAGDCLVFQPGFGNCLSITAAQLLAEMGLGTGSGFGGTGAGGGYSAQRGAMQNMGLYGSMPGMGDAFGTGPTGSGPAVDPRGDFARGGVNPDESTRVDGPAAGSAAGIGEAAVPVRYRRQVGQYFQRIAEEVEEK